MTKTILIFKVKYKNKKLMEYIYIINYYQFSLHISPRSVLILIGTYRHVIGPKISDQEQ